MSKICNRCEGPVFAAEERRALGRYWHLECFTCRYCGKSLDSTTLEENRKSGDIYCSPCYKRLFAITSYGQGRSSLGTVKNDRIDALAGGTGDFSKSSTLAQSIHKSSHRNRC